MKSITYIIQGYLGMTPKDKGVETWTEMQSQMEEEINNHFKEETQNLWHSFKDKEPEVGQYVEIWWSTDEITKQVWQNDVAWCGIELPRFWRTLKK